MRRRSGIAMFCRKEELFHSYDALQRYLSLLFQANNSVFLDRHGLRDDREAFYAADSQVVAIQHMSNCSYFESGCYRRSETSRVCVNIPFVI